MRLCPPLDVYFPPRQAIPMVLYVCIIYVLYICMYISRDLLNTLHLFQQNSCFTCTYIITSLGNIHIYGMYIKQQAFIRYIYSNIVQITYINHRAGHSLFISRFALRSPLFSFPWIAIALALIQPISRFAHRSIALEKTSGSLSEKSAKTQNRS